MMVLSYFFHQLASQPASRFAGIQIRDAAQQPPPNNRGTSVQRQPNLPFLERYKGSATSGHVPFSLVGKWCCLDTPSVFPWVGAAGQEWLQKSAHASH